jgi:hypothetical protein
MKHKYLTILLLLIVVQLGYSQEDLLDILQEEENKAPITEYAYATFKASRVINGQSVELTSKNELSFVIQHRFGKINEGFYGLFGLDQSTIRFGFEYGVFRWLNIGVGRSSYKKTFDGTIKLKIARQQTGARTFPLNIGLFSSIASSTLKWDDPDRPNYYTSRMSFTHQLLIARKFGNAISVQLSPSYVHRNFVATAEDQNDVYAVGFAGRVKLTNRMAINAEYFYQIEGYNRAVTFDAVALGIDLETGGHVFQIMVTNSKGMIDPYFIAETTGDITKGELYLGFNISRVFSFSKKEEY